MKKMLIGCGLILLVLFTACSSYFLGRRFRLFRFFQSHSLSSVGSLMTKKKELPLLQYRFADLRGRSYQSSTLHVDKVLAKFPTYTSYQFSFVTFGKNMTGQLNLPTKITGKMPVVVLLRGYVPVEKYQTGIGTKAAAGVFAAHGYVTLAPDFFGYGESDPEPKDVWEARFQKPINVVELLKSIQDHPNLSVADNQTVQLDQNRVGMWAHSNGGQIALSALEIWPNRLPATLWAPVSAPFPYSILYFSDEDMDEGKSARNSVAQFEQDYNVFDFSLTRHLNFLQGPLQIQQGTGDEAIHYTWSAEFVSKIKNENALRATASASVASTTPTTSSTSATTTTQTSGALPSQPIAVQLFTYPGADHNMRPGWDQAIQRDLAFFVRELP
jgi:pimeloyl-ACP methyl ester carboxylesterase